MPLTIRLEARTLFLEALEHQLLWGVEQLPMPAVRGPFSFADHQLYTVSTLLGWRPSVHTPWVLCNIVLPRYPKLVIFPLVFQCGLRWGPPLLFCAYRFEGEPKDRGGVP